MIAKTEKQFVVWLPEGHTDPPTTVLEVLWNVAALHAQERWVKAVWFRNDHPEVEPDNPFCNDWSACLQAQIGLCTIGAERVVAEYVGGGRHQTSWGFDHSVPYSWAATRSHERDFPRRELPPRHGLYVATVEFVRARIRGYENIPAFNDNDSTSHADVTELLNQCIVDAQSMAQNDPAVNQGSPLAPGDLTA